MESVDESHPNPQPLRVVISWRRPGVQGASRLPALSSPGCSFTQGSSAARSCGVTVLPELRGSTRLSGSRLPPGKTDSSMISVFLRPLGLLSQPRPQRLQYRRSGRAPSQTPAHHPVLCLMARPQPWFQNRGNHVAC